VTRDLGVARPHGARRPEDAALRFELRLRDGAEEVDQQLIHTVGLVVMDPVAVFDRHAALIDARRSRIACAPTRSSG
jgi:hypothetical protein